MLVLPPPPARRLTTAEAIAIAKRGRKLLRKGSLTHHQTVILECLLWACRNLAIGAIVVSYTALQCLCHCARGTIAAALDALLRVRVRRHDRPPYRRTQASAGAAHRADGDRPSVQQPAA